MDSYGCSGGVDTAVGEARGSEVEYRDIPGYPGYKAGSDGSIWSRRIRITRQGFRGSLCGFGDKWKKLGCCKNQDGYLVFRPADMNGRRKQMQVHQAVLMAFVGPRPPGKINGCHNNGNKLDNRATNLRWDTVSENHRDSIKHGTMKTGQHAHIVKHQRKFSDEQVIGIRRRAANGESSKKIADELGVCEGTICNIKSRKTYSWL